MASQDLVVTGVDLEDLTDRGLLKATLAAVTRLESQMSQMNEALGRLSTAVTEQQTRMQGQVDSLAAALEAERAESARLAEAEAVEDVNQDQALSDARAQTDQALAELQSGVEQVNQLADQVSGVQGGGGDQAAPDVEAEQPAPAPEQPQPPVPDAEEVQQAEAEQNATDGGGAQPQQ